MLIMKNSRYEMIRQSMRQSIDETVNWWNSQSMKQSIDETVNWWNSHKAPGSEGAFMYGLWERYERDFTVVYAEELAKVIESELLL